MSSSGKNEGPALSAATLRCLCQPGPDFISGPPAQHRRVEKPHSLRLRLELGLLRRAPGMKKGLEAQSRTGQPQTSGTGKGGVCMARVGEAGMKTPRGWKDIPSCSVCAAPSRVLIGS